MDSLHRLPSQRRRLPVWRVLLPVVTDARDHPLWFASDILGHSGWYVVVVWSVVVGGSVQRDGRQRSGVEAGCGWRWTVAAAAGGGGRGNWARHHDVTSADIRRRLRACTSTTCNTTHHSRFSFSFLPNLVRSHFILFFSGPLVVSSFSSHPQIQILRGGLGQWCKLPSGTKVEPRTPSRDFYVF